MKNENIEIDASIEIKKILQQAADALEISLEQFMLESSVDKAKEIISSSIINLTYKEATRLLSTLENPPESNANLRKLFSKFSKKKKISTFSKSQECHEETNKCEGTDHYEQGNHN